jgi:all-trans-retinol 13,14-reductase
MTTSLRESKSYSLKSPEQEWDYLVIGSGMGGMCSAALLAKLGKKVLVLEQHYVPGGFTHTFKRKKWVWDVGVHAVGEVTGHSLIGRLLKELTDAKLEWTSLGENYDEFLFPDNFQINFPNTPEKFKENLINAFPGEKVAINNYFAYIKKVSVAMRKYYMARVLPFQIAGISDRLIAGEAQKLLELRTKNVLDQLTDNHNLKTVLAAQWGYYGSPPSRSSFAIHALVSKHFAYGGYYPIGGSKKIAEHLLKTVADNGGWTRVRADVSEIVIKNGKATGVLLKNGEQIKAKKIISSVGAIATVKRLLPEPEQQKQWVNEIAKLKPSSAHLCLNIGFKGDISKAGASASNKWFWETWDAEFESWDIEKEDSLAPVLYTSFPSLKDPLHQPGPENLHTGEVVTFVPYENFSKWKDTRLMKRGTDYEGLKKELTDRLLNQLLKYMPDLKPMISMAELSTPLSTEHFTRAVSGAIYGIEPTPERYKNPWLRPHTPVKNLYMGGSDMATVGVIGAMVGGILAATAAEPVKAIKFIRSIR